MKVLTLKDAPASTQPNMLRHLQELPSECIVASEFKRMDNFEMRKLIQSKRRHFHNSKTSVMSYVNLSSQLLRLGNERDNATADDALRHLRHARDEFVSRIRSDSDRVDGCSDRPRHVSGAATQGSLAIGGIDTAGHGPSSDILYNLCLRIAR